MVASGRVIVEGIGLIVLMNGKVPELVTFQLCSHVVIRVDVGFASQPHELNKEIVILLDRSSSEAG